MDVLIHAQLKIRALLVVFRYRISTVTVKRLDCYLIL